MKEIDTYFINYETLLILPYGSKKSKVYELDEVFIVNSDVFTIVKNSCLYFGSSLEGRKEGTAEAGVKDDTGTPYYESTVG